MRVDLIGRDYEWEISKILLMVDPGVGVTILHNCVRVHGVIASSRVWVHDTVIHHSWLMRVDSCNGRVSGINNICFLCSSYCCSQATAV